MNTVEHSFLQLSSQNMVLDRFFILRSQYSMDILCRPLVNLGIKKQTMHGEKNKFKSFILGCKIGP